MPVLCAVCAALVPNRYGQLLSNEPLRVNFHPSSLLSIGDLLAFVRDLSAAATSSPAASPAAQQGMQLAAHSSAQLGDDQLLHMYDSMNGGAARQHSMPDQQPQQYHVVPQPMAALSSAEAPPSIEEQMALADGLTSRIPQRWAWLAAVACAWKTLRR